MKIKRYLNDVLQAKLAPIRERREEYAKDTGYILEMLKEGSENAESVAAQTLDNVKRAMGINYF